MKNALIVVDMQNDYYIDGKNELHKIKDTLSNIVELVSKAHKAGEEVIFIQHIAPKDAPFFAKDTSGAQLHKNLPILKQDTIIT